MFPSNYYSTRRLAFDVKEKCREMLDFIFVMAMKPTTLVYVGLTNKQGHLTRLGGTIDNVLED